MVLDYRIRVNGRTELFTIHVSQNDRPSCESFLHCVQTLIWWCKLSSHVWKELCSSSSRRGLLVGRCEVEPSCCKPSQFSSDRAVTGTVPSISSRRWNSAAHNAPRPIQLRPAGSVTWFSRKGSLLRLTAMLPSHTPGNRGWPQQMSSLTFG